MASNNLLILAIICTIFAIGVVGAKDMNSVRLAARDAITLAANEIFDTQKLISTITQLRTLQMSSSPNEAALARCREDLDSCMSNAHAVLMRMRVLDNKFSAAVIDSEVASLKKTVVGGIGSSNNACTHGLKNAEPTMVLLLNRKLEDVIMLSNNVINRVNEFKQTN